MNMIMGMRKTADRGGANQAVPHVRCERISGVWPQRLALLIFLCVSGVFATQAAAVPPSFSGGEVPRLHPETDSFDHLMPGGFRPMVAQAPLADRWDKPWKVLLLLVEFEDQPALTEPEYFAEMLFGRSGGFGGAKLYPRESMADMYARMSGGRLTFQEPTIIGWIKAPNHYEHYVRHPSGNGCYGLGPGSSGLSSGAWEILRFALDQAVAQGVDLLDFDNDGDGIPESIFLVHAGHGAEVTAGNDGGDCLTTDIWSHQHRNTYNGKQVRYLVGPQQSTLASDGLAAMGVWAHEFGHILGLPDLYAKEIGNGVGCWDLMGYGIRSCSLSWSDGDPHTKPSELSARTRELLGWVQPREVIENVCNRELEPLVTGGEVLKIVPNKAQSWDYFLVEYRAQIGMESDFPGNRVCLWHIDRREPVWGSNQPNDKPCQPSYGQAHPAPGACAERSKHYGVSLVQPDGRYTLEFGQSFMQGGHCLDEFSEMSSRHRSDMLPWSGRADFEWTIRTGSLGDRARVSILVDDETSHQSTPRITTEPKGGAIRGAVWKYAPALEAQAGLPEWRLVEGPNEMTVDPDTGALSWKVPRRYPADEVRIKLQVSNCGGTTDQLFYLGVFDPEIKSSGCRTAQGEFPFALLLALSALLVHRIMRVSAE